MRVRKYPLAGTGGKNRSPDALGNFGECLATADRAASDQNKRAHCGGEAIRCLIDRRRIRHRQGWTASSFPIALDR